MTNPDHMQRARELLAAEWRADGRDDMAIRLQNPDLVTAKNPAIRAIMAALAEPKAGAVPGWLRRLAPKWQYDADNAVGLNAGYRKALRDVADELSNSIEYHQHHAAPQAKPGEPFQSRVAPWMQECFGATIASDVRERGDRLLEEVLELLQSHGYDPARVATLRDYVFGRPVGEPQQEVGGVMVTLAAYCLATGIDMHAAGDIELARISAPEVVERIRVKQASKRGLHTPLPVPPPAEQQGQAVALPERIVLWGRATNPYWFFVAEKSDRPDCDGIPVYETLDPITRLGSPEAGATVDAVRALPAKWRERAAREGTAKSADWYASALEAALPAQGREGEVGRG